MNEEYTAEDVSWSIHLDTKGNVDEWVDENRVGFDKWIENIPDGIYQVNQRDWNSNRRITLKNKVLVWDGKVDIESSKKAVAEFLNKTGDCHRFIDGVRFGKKSTKVYDTHGKLVETKRTLEFWLGS
jgi:hypothetical protein